MNITPIRAADIVECDVRGRRFYALVLDNPGRELKIRPISPGINHYTVTARQVIGHFRRSRAQSRTGKQEEEGHG